jgi:hypothetical protein
MNESKNCSRSRHSLSRRRCHSVKRLHVPSSSNHNAKHNAARRDGTHLCPTDAEWQDSLAVAEDG